MDRFLRIFFVGILFSGLLCKEAFAVLPSISAGQDLEAQAARFQQEYALEKRMRMKERKKPSIEFKEKEEKTTVPEASFSLNSIRLSGTTVFTPSQLAFIWQPYIGKKVTYKDLDQIVQLIKRVYKNLGYLATIVYLPPQDIKNGDVDIRLVEGKRGNLLVEGNKWFSTSSITRYFHSQRGEPLDMAEVQKDIARLNDNRDLNVSAILSPGEEPESVDVTLQAKESLPFHVSLGTDNQGSRLTGRYRETVGLHSSNLTGVHDDLAINSVFSQFSFGQFVSYQRPVGTYGTVIGMDAGYFEAKLGQEYLPYDVTTATQFYNPNVSFELYQSQDVQLNLRSGMRIKDIRKKEGQDKDTDERLRLPYVGVDFNETDQFGKTFFSPEMVYGMQGALGASSRNNSWASRPGADGGFVKYDHSISRQQIMPLDSYMQISSQFQYASRTLPTSEQIQLGGTNSVRGYPEGDFLADIGANLRMDWYFPMYPVPASWEVMTVKLRNVIEPVLFFDMGKGKLLKSADGEVKSKLLAGAGGGFRVRVKNNMYLKLEWAKSLGDRPIRGTGPSVFGMSFQCGM